MRQCIFVLQAWATEHCALWHDRAPRARAAVRHCVREGVMRQRGCTRRNRAACSPPRPIQDRSCVERVPARLLVTWTIIARTTSYRYSSPDRRCSISKKWSDSTSYLIGARQEHISYSSLIWIRFFWRQLMVSFWQNLVKKMCWFGKCDGNFDCLMWDYWNWLAFYRFFVDIFWLFLDCLDYTIMDYSRLDSLIGLQGQLDYRNLY